ncbi:gamma-glutamyltranspeptidase [Pseudovirgaria hyperparasitica]|uniref:Gamma-glutamyltranspeptidase n=1 Tax=Pseudovirgaria hyperparasitica TaxID=470096 RepID=A0A6A6WAB7_9PEZI|nr:gamma-glutamyltranspeptidase [Pseudovirgaria hyperparasitica]KAF2758537.1 gamma-glutamyltranspeptidase [Pseudovirgaria hyperparasitica]
MPLSAKHIYPASDPQFITFPSRRSTVHSSKGIVSSTQPLATQAGLEILRQGGNAADAAVAVAAGLNMTEPGSTGIGGDCFCLYYNAKTKKISAMNGSGRSGSKTSLEQVRHDLGIADGKAGSIPVESVHAVTVPGAAAGWVDTVERFGSGKLTLEQILMPAIEMGEKGFPVSELSSTFWLASEDKIRNASPNFAEMLKKDPSAKDGCRAPQAGEIMKNPNMANTYRLLAKHGKKGFYEGQVAEALVKVVTDLGGHLTLDDLKDHATAGSEDVDAISLVYSGHGIDPVRVWEHPPNGQGIVALMALGMLQELEKCGKVTKWSEKDHNSAKHLHTLIEVLRIAFADARWWVTDPNVVNVPTAELISPSYLSSRASLFSPTTASALISHGSPAHNHSDTVYFSVADAAGNGISFINSNYSGFGTGIIPAGCGFTLQNRAGNFALQPADHPNVYAPNKRPYHTIIPALITNAEDDTLHSVYGVMGGFMQPQGHVQVLLNMTVFGLHPQAALDAPRFCIGAGMPEAGDVADRTVYLEDGIKDEVVQELRAMGHKVEVVKGYARGLFGRGQLIRRHEDDGQLVWSAGSDPRGDGSAMPQ